MLTNRQVSLAKKELRARKARIDRARKGDLSKIDHEVARVVGCGSTVIAFIRRGVRKPNQVRSTLPEPTTCVCPNCGPIKAPFCVFCETMKMNGSRPKCPEPVDDEPESGYFSPEEIYTRAANIRAKNSISRNPIESYEDSLAYSLWVDPEDFQRPKNPADDNK